MTLSVVIPCWSGTPELAEMALRLCYQVRPMCDELVVTDDGDYSPRLQRIADIYLNHFPRLGHVKNLARGIAASTGDYVGVLDSDIVIIQGSLRDLCIPNKAVCGLWGEFPDCRDLMGWCFVIDRKLVQKHPVVDSEYEGLGMWIINLSPYTEILDTFEYSHLQKRSYRELLRLGGTIGHIQTREIVSERHKSRMNEDPIYRERWETES